MDQVRGARTIILHKSLAVPQPAQSIPPHLLPYQREIHSIMEKRRLERTSGDHRVQPSLEKQSLMSGYPGPCKAEPFTPLGNLFQYFTVLMAKNCSIKTEFPLKQP